MDGVGEKAGAGVMGKKNQNLICNLSNHSNLEKIFIMSRHKATINDSAVGLLGFLALLSLIQVGLI